MMVDAIPGGIIKRIVIVSFTKKIECNPSISICVAKKYMAEFYSNSCDDELNIESIGNDYDNNYGYAQEHHTV